MIGRPVFLMIKYSTEITKKYKCSFRRELVMAKALFWGKAPTSDIDAREQQLAALEKHISSMKNDLAEVKREATRSLLEVEARRTQAQKEEAALNTLRKEVRERVELAERKETHLRKLEAQFAASEKRAHDEESRVEHLRQEQAKLSNELSTLEKTLTERKAAVQQAQKILSQSNREIDVLSARREEIKQLDASVEQLSYREKQLNQEVGRKEKRVQDGAQILASQQHELETAKVQVKQLTSQLGQAQSFLASLNKDIAANKRELSQLLAQKTTMNNQKTEQEQRSKVLAEQGKSITQKMREIERFRNQAAEIERKEKSTAAMLEEKKQILIQLRVAIDKNTQTLENLQNQEAKVKAATHSFLITQQERSRKMTEQEQALAQQENTISDQRKMLEERIKQVSIAEQAFERKVNSMSSMRSEVESLDRRKQEALTVLSEKKNVLDELRRSTSEQQKTLIQLKSEEKEAHEAAAKLLAGQREFNKRLKVLEQKEEQIMAKEKHLTGRENALANREVALTEATHLLTQDKEGVSLDIKAREEAFLSLQKDWNEHVEEFKREKDDLKTEKSDVRKLIESDILELKSKEDELVATVVSLETDKKKLEDEEHALISRIGEFEKAKATFDKERASLEAMRKNIADNERMVQKSLKFIETEKKKLEHERDQAFRARVLRKALPAMERKYELLQNEINKLQLNAVEKVMTLSKRKQMVAQEHDLDEKEHLVHLETKRLMARQREVEELEERKDVSFYRYLRDETTREKQGTMRESHADIRSMINEARENVEHGNIDDAVRIISEAEYLVDKVNDPEKKRLLHYDVRDVKASIKLATLS